MDPALLIVACDDEGAELPNLNAMAKGWCRCEASGRASSTVTASDGINVFSQPHRAAISLESVMGPVVPLRRAR